MLFTNAGAHVTHITRVTETQKNPSQFAFLQISFWLLKQVESKLCLYDQII